MRKEDFIRRLERARMPEIIITQHRSALKQALMQYQSADVRPARAHIWEDVLRGFRNWLREPFWKTGLASALTVFLVAAVFSMFFYIASPSPAVIAADVVKKDPLIQQSLSGQGEIYVVRVVVKQDTASVVCGRGIGDFMEAEVDISQRAVISTRRYEGIFMQELPLAAQDEAVKIARSEPRVREIMERGGKVGKVFPVFTGISNLTMAEGNLVKVIPTSAQAVVSLMLEGRTWLVQVNLDESRTERVLESQKLRLHYSEFSPIRCTF